MAKEEKEKAAFRLYRKLEGRERLRKLAEESAPKTREQAELDRLRAYLFEWANRQADHKPKLGDPDSCLSYYVKDSSPRCTDLLEQSNGWAMSVLDASIDDLITIPKDGALMRSALRVRWLNEGIAPGGEIKIRVLRHGRLLGMSLMEADALADRAELALLPICKRRGLPL